MFLYMQEVFKGRDPQKIRIYQDTGSVTPSIILHKKSVCHYSFNVKTVLLIWLHGALPNSHLIGHIGYAQLNHMVESTRVFNDVHL